MSGFDRSEGTRTRTDRVSDSSIVQSFEKALENALEHAEAALMYSEILSHREAADGVEAFEKLAAAALRGLTNCQRAQSESEAYEIEEVIEEESEPGYEIVAVKPPPAPEQENGGREITKKRRALTIEDASEFLGCSVEEVRGLLKVGDIVPVFQGKETRIHLAELENYNRQNQRTMNAPIDESPAASDLSMGEDSDFDEIVDKLFEDESYDMLGDEESDVMMPDPDTTDELKRSSIAELFKRVRGDD